MGMLFPLHFGFIPHTKGEDGDPIDVLVLMDEAAYPGSHIECRIIGAIEAEQTEKGKTVKNDRIIVAAKESYRYATVDSLSDIDKKMLDGLTSFFKNYNAFSGKEFKVTGYAKKNKTYSLIKKYITNE